MRSGTSYFNGTIFKKTVLRFWPVWAAYFVIWFIALPLNGLMMLSLAMGGTIRNIGYMENFACRTVPGMAAELALVVAVVFGLLAAMAVFSHLYSARPANFFGTLPVRREGLFVTHYLAGLAFLLVPNAVIALLTLIIEAAGGWVSLQGLWFWLAVSCGEGFLFYSMAVFCAMFTGHILALPVFYTVFNAIAAGVYGLANWVSSAFFYGYTSSGGYWGYRVARLLTPVWSLSGSVYSYYQGSTSAASSAPAAGLPPAPRLTTEGLGLVGGYTAAALVLAVCAFLLYRVRRLESAGDVVSVKPMRPVFKYGVAVCSGFTFGLGTSFFLNMGEVGMMVSIVVWGVAGCFVAQMLLDKSFRVFKKWKGGLALTAVFLVLFAVVAFDLTGFETRIPSQDQVESVDFSGLDGTYLGDSGDYASSVTSDPEQIGWLMTLHRAAIQQRDGWRPNGSMSTSLRYNTSLRLTYCLKDGSTMARYYDVYFDPAEYTQEGTAAWALEQFYADRGLYWEVYGFEEMERRMDEEGWWMEQARYSYYQYNEDRQDADRFYYGKDAQAVFEAMKEDFRAGRIGVRTLAEMNPMYGREYEREIRFTVVNGEHGQMSVNIFVQDTASSTIAAMEALDDTP